MNLLLALVLTCSCLLPSSNGKANLACRLTSDCPPNSSCEEGKICFCNQGYIGDITTTLRCLKEASGRGDPCEKDIQCEARLGIKSHCSKVNSEDKMGKCACNNGSHLMEGICHTNAYVGDSCVVSDDCIIKSQGIKSYCDTGKCVCPRNHFASDDKMDCIPFAGLGERCENSSCIIPNSECKIYCACKMGYVPNGKTTRCLEAADDLDGACEEDTQCTEFLKLSRCDQKTKKCACDSFAHRVKNQCWLSIKMLGLCEYDDECYVKGDREGVQCKDGACACVGGYESYGAACVKFRVAGFKITTSGSMITGDYRAKAALLTAASIYLLLFY